ncbi:MAG: pilus assembly protein PilM [Gammaproteobacteria bacterium]|nr:pilus assembly protein PilM [Gammaproteobacteria bacterium]
MWLRKMLKRDSGLVGIDIAFDAIRIIELSKMRKSYKVENWANVEYQSLVDHKDTDNIIASLKFALEEAKSQSKNAAIALAHSALINKFIMLPKEICQKNLDDFLEFNIEKYIGYSAAKVSFDYQMVEQDADREKIKIEVAAVKRECIERCIAILEGANLKPKFIDMNAYALARAAKFELPNIKGVMVIVNIEQNNLLLVALDGEKMIYANEIALAEKSCQDTAKIYTEIKSAIELFNSAAHSPISCFVLGGMVSGIDNLVLQVDKLNVGEVRVANPFKLLQFAAHINQAEFMQKANSMLISFGLALRRFNREY